MLQPYVETTACISNVVDLFSIREEDFQTRMQIGACTYMYTYVYVYSVVK